MPNLNIIITTAAEVDMQNIFDFIAQDNCRLSDRLRKVPPEV